MSPKKTIQARDIVIDIRGGMTDAELMEKYGLSAKGLASAFEKLVNSRIMTVEEVYGQCRSGSDTVIIDDVRSCPRHLLTVAVPIYESEKPQKKGKLRDITERGLGIIGLESRIGEVKGLVIPCRGFLDADHIWFEAECMWAEAGKTPEEWAGGFQITKISKEDLKRLRELIRFLTLG
ncbi:MAG: PilZ domain-containing protein [Desulfomonile tiedjei]|nr:PilZ domain-containing protein [Desulfomonile tiedjei]